jgi:hypothetical protein
VGVALGDLIWPLAAILGLSWIHGSSVYGDVLSILRWVAAAIFLVMGWLLIRKPAAHRHRQPPDRPGRWAGFAAGVAAVIGNPKAILFYMGVLPGFFDLRRVTGRTSPRSRDLGGDPDGRQPGLRALPRPRAGCCPQPARAAAAERDFGRLLIAWGW